MFSTIGEAICNATYLEFGSESISNYLLKEILGILDESADMLLKELGSQWLFVDGHSDQKSKYQKKYQECKQNSDQESR